MSGIMANKSRYLMGKKNPSPEPISDVCPHQHFKTDVIDRKILSRKQHLNLLCTPKGYRWMIKGADRSTPKIPNGVTDPCKLSKKKPGKTYVHNILAEIWDLVTPEMAQRMKEMLMADFGLSEEAALDFICHSRYDTTLTANPKDRGNTQRKDDRPPEGSTIPCLAAAQKLCKNDFNIDVSPFHIKEFSKTVSSKLSEYVAAMACAKRDSKHRVMAETILKGLCDLTGEETTLDKPKNRLHKILTFTSDRLALLMVDNMEDEDESRANRRKREDRALKRKKLARQREQRNRQKEKDKINKVNRKNEKRRAEEEAEKKRAADKEKERKRAEREKRHQELEKFREEENQKQKEEMKKAKAESEAAKGKSGQAGGDRSKPQSRGDQPGTKSKPAGPTKTGQNYRPTNEQTRRGDVKAGPKGQPVSKPGTSRGNQGKSQQGSTTGAPSSNTAKKTPLAGNEKQANLKVASESLAGTKATDSRTLVPASESLGGTPATKKVERITSQGGDTETETNPNQNELNQETSKLSQMSKSVIWGDDPIKNVASAFSASGKKTPTSSKSSSIDKLVEILSSQGKTASKISSKRKSADTAAVSSQDGLPAAHSSQGILAKVISSQGKLTSEHTSHLNLGTVSTSENKLSTTDSRGRKESILMVKRTVSDNYEVNRTTYAEAKQKIGAVKRKLSAPTLPPTVPFDASDPKSWEQWIEYTTRLAEDWGRWIDKTIQDTEDKAILYQAKAKEGKTDPQDVEDWNRFVEQTNEDARRWRRQRKAMMDAANERKQH